MDSTFYKKIATRLMMGWFTSQWRSALFNFRYITWPKWCKRQIKLDIYLALNDPYSYLLVQLLPALEQCFDVKLSLHLISENLPSDTYAANAWHRWAWQDCQALAVEYHLPPMTEKPSLRSVVTGQQLWQLQPKTLTNAIALFHQTWRNDFTCHYPHSTPVINSLITNQMDMISRGFYLPASIYCMGEWYWGLDRLALLSERLTTLLVNKPAQTAHFFANTPADFLIKQGEEPSPSPVALLNNSTPQPMIIYLSLRSPYSYLGLVKAQTLAKKYQLPLLIKPVLPLVMRGAKLSKNKLKYIYLDARRQCQLLSVPFARFVDPLGKGIENCYQLLPYVAQQNAQIRFFEVMFQAVNVQGINLADQRNMLKLCRSIDLDYHAAVQYATEHSWHAMVEQNQQELTALGFWGVPCFQYQQTAVWGQDRLYRIEQAIIEQQKLQ